MGSVEAIARRFPIGACAPPRRVASGLMHATYLVDAERGRFVLQRLHPKLATPEIAADFRAVTEHLASRAQVAPRLVGPGVITDAEDGAAWRMTTYVHGATHDAVGSPAEAEQGARVLGRFHRVMADLAHDFRSAHPLHDTAAHLAALRTAVANPAHAEARAQVQDEIDQVLALLPTAMLPADLPRRVVHGDPKISNVVFRGSRAVGLIDLDTCNRHSVLVDLGDAVRSWCRDGSEDERHRFQIDRFEAMLRGYVAEGPPLSPQEAAHLVDAGRLITLELASRFARDVLEDEYFAFDAERYPDRRSHNRARTRAMLYLAQDMADQRDAVAALVERHVGGCCA
ncbi:MAG: phosphotransferase [Myxococcales bacterium]|nr:phosphotransferase [Myxococcales bacterium]